MSYSLRNTILLAVTLTLFLLAGGLWLYFAYYSPISHKNAAFERNEVQLASLQSEAQRFPETFEMYNELNYKLENFPKTFFPDHRLSNLYNYLNVADRGFVFMNFDYADSTSHGEYGRIRFNVDGVSDYRQLRDFIYTLEGSGPIVRINNLQVRPTSNSENLHEVGFRLQVEAFYSRTDRVVEMQQASLITGEHPRNPFFPLVHNPKANENNMIEPERSRLQAISHDTIFIYDQNNQLKRLRLHDRVHLGYLERISADNQEATFYLNKGGIVERVTLKLKK